VAGEHVGEGRRVGLRDRCISGRGACR
jgi:hypothetical protein